MPVPQEICVFFPCHTLEDFPTHPRDEAAEGILAAWTAPWHPAVLAAVKAVPTWHRADTPPVDLANRLLLIPEAAESRLPKDLPQRLGDAIDCQRISVTSRAAATKEIIEHLQKPGIDAPAYEDSSALLALSEASAAGNHDADNAALLPTIEHFHALGFAALQVQVMTRKLRYSGNLDLVTFAEHAVSAAQSWLEHDVVNTRARLQAAFDLLGEERDHYFTGDPYLIDLVLIAPSTVGPDLEQTLAGDQPLNLLMSGETARLIAQQYPEIAKRISERWQAGTLSVAGGAPNDDDRLDLASCSSIARWIQSALDSFEAAFGRRPKVFGRVGGGIPGDLTPWLVSAGMIGAITNDFASGVGSQNEAKMLWQSGGAEIEALTAKPLDATQPHSFLGIGPKLGEAADSGQVAAALFARWPGTSSDWLRSLSVVGQYTPALGRLWTLEDFFSKGERPYHSCGLPAVVGDGEWLSQSVSNQIANPLSSAASRQVAALRTEAVSTCQTLVRLLKKHESTSASEDDSLQSAAQQLAVAMGLSPFKTPHVSAQNDHVLNCSAAALVQPFDGAFRSQVEISGPPPGNATPGLFAASSTRHGSRLTIDIPGPGFATFKSGGPHSNDSKAPKSSWLGLFKRKRNLAYGMSLANEFLDIAIHPETGAVAAVHCGAQRGNRFSWQLAYYDRSGPGDGYSKMICDRSRVTEADLARGAIQTEGRLLVDQNEIAKFVCTYSIDRGSRWLDIDLQLSFDAPLSELPWQNYIAGRAAWASAALSIRPIVRDKRHRTSGKRIEAPLGVVVDEGDRKLQICTYGLPAHRRLGTERLDSLLVVRGETARQFKLSYGFDVKAPVRAARAKLCPPVAVPLESLSEDPARSWLLDIDSPRVVGSDWFAIDASRARVTLIETTGSAVKTRVRCFRDIAVAKRATDGREITVEQGAAIVSLDAHEVVTVELELA